jgi:hypothetical protein
MRRFVAILLLFSFVALGTGTLEYLHNLQHQHEDAAQAAAARTAGLPDAPDHRSHDDSNCEFHSRLHLALMTWAWVPLLVLLGLFVAFLTPLAPVPPAQQPPSRLSCRGPPLR